MSPWEVNKCQRNVGLFMYLLGLCYISKKALWHLVITSLEDITQDNSTVNISKEFQRLPQYNKSVSFLRHYCVEKYFPLHHFLCQVTCSGLYFFNIFLRIHKQMSSARRNQVGLRLCVFHTIIFILLSSKLWVLSHNICKEKNLIRMMLKPFSRIQVKIYGCSIGDSIFLAALLVPCNELHSPLVLFGQAYSVTQL